MLSMGVCTTGHWETTGRLVQELNICTVAYVLTKYDGARFSEEHCKFVLLVFVIILDC